MNDIKRPSQSLRSSRTPIVKTTREVKAHAKDLTSKVEEFERFRYVEESVPEEEEENFYNSRLRHKKQIKVKSKMSLQNKIFWYALATLAVIFLLWTFVFRSAKINLTPRTKDFTIKDSLILTNTETEKIYDVVEITKSDKKTITKSATKILSTKASGKITIFNNYSEATQKLIKNTRFESVEGKIFRISDTIIVPGKVGATPGSIVATVYADSIGADYNIAAGKFTVPGFKGSARYAGFYAESKVSMTGGASGEVANYSDYDIADADAAMRESLQSAINTELINIKKDGYVSMQSSIRYDSVNNKQDLLSGKSAVYTESITGQILLVKTKALESLIAQKVLTPYKGEMVSVKDMSAIVFSFAKDTKLSLNTPVVIFAEGTSKIVYMIDKDALQNMLMSKSSEEFNGIIQSNFKNEVDSATSSLSPFWVNSYPANKNKINVVEDSI